MLRFVELTAWITPVPALAQAKQSVRAPPLVDGLTGNVEQRADLIGCQGATRRLQKLKSMFGVAGDERSERFEPGDRRTDHLGITQNARQSPDIGRGTEGLRQTLDRGFSGDTSQGFE
jgi:hypothetical protein